MNGLAILNYAGPAPAAHNRTILSTLWRLLVSIIVFAVLLAYVTLRGTVLLAGYILVLAGTILLTIGGRRSAAVKLAAWRARASELVRLWIADILRPLRRRRHSLQPVLLLS
jgi:hypothetical protein